MPIALTQLGQIAMMTTDLALIGRLGDEAVAAAALAHTVFFVTFTFGMGLVSAVAPLAAQAFGARNPRMVRRALRVGLWAALLISLPMIVLPLYGEQILLALGQAPATAHLAQKYLLGLAWGIAPALWFLAIRGFMGAVNRPEPGLWITLAAIPANARAGLSADPWRHGDCRGWNCSAPASPPRSSISACSWRRCGLRYAAGRSRNITCWAASGASTGLLMRQLIVIGAPISISFLLEYGLFGAAALLMGLISTTALAAHQIALQIAAILFMVPFGIGMAATVRVGHAVGRNDAPAVKRAGFVATLLGIVFMSVMTLAVILGRFAIARFFFGEAAESGGRRHRTHRDLADGRRDLLHRRRHPDRRGRRAARHQRHAGAAAVRRDQLLADRISRPPAALGFRTALGAIGVWIGLSCGTAVYAVLLVLRFRLLANRLATRAIRGDA